jgi:hypothetical protein
MICSKCKRKVTWRIAPDTDTTQEIIPCLYCLYTAYNNGEHDGYMSNLIKSGDESYFGLDINEKDYPTYFKE